MEMKIITAIRGEEIKVDDGDFERLNAYRWYCNSSKGYVYPRSTINGKLLAMHRFIMAVTNGSILVDHIDHDTLNNQRSNLRLCTKSQNLMNRNRSYGTSKFIGVSKHSLRDLYAATVYVNRKQICLGYFKDEIEAAHVRDAAAKIHYGEFARLNFG